MGKTTPPLHVALLQKASSVLMRGAQWAQALAQRQMLAREQSAEHAADKDLHPAVRALAQVRQMVATVAELHGAGADKLERGMVQALYTSSQAAPDARALSETLAEGASLEYMDLLSPTSQQAVSAADHGEGSDKARVLRRRMIAALIEAVILSSHGPGDLACPYQAGRVEEAFDRWVSGEDDGAGQELLAISQMIAAPYGDASQALHARLGLALSCCGAIHMWRCIQEMDPVRRVQLGWTQ